MKLNLLYLLMAALFVLPAASLARNASGSYSIGLKSFIASSDGKTARLNWDLEELEYDITCFLERSEDGIHFEAIAHFELAEGFKGLMQHSDKALTNGVKYYRLRMEKGGYLPFISGVIFARITNASATENTYQAINPFHQTLTIQGRFARGTVTVLVSDLTGKLLLQQQVVVAANQNSISFPGHQLQRGLYIIRVNENTGTATRLVLSQFIVKNTQ